MNHLTEDNLHPSKTLQGTLSLIKPYFPSISLDCLKSEATTLTLLAAFLKSESQFLWGHMCDFARRALLSWDNWGIVHGLVGKPKTVKCQKICWVGWVLDTKKLKPATWGARRGGLSHQDHPPQTPCTFHLVWPISITTSPLLRVLPYQHLHSLRHTVKTTSTSQWTLILQSHLPPPSRLLRRGKKKEKAQVCISEQITKLLYVSISSPAKINRKMVPTLIKQN